MSDLKTIECEACRVDAPKVTAEERQDLMPQIPEWQHVMQHGVEQLRRVFNFDNYPDAVQFTQAVADLAESRGHHPEIILEWGKVTVSWWTHKINGLHKNDFILAAQTDDLI